MGLILSDKNGGKGRIFLQINGGDGVISASEKDPAGSWKTTKFDQGTVAIEGTVISLETKNDEVKGQALVKGILLLRDTKPGEPDIQLEFGLWRQKKDSTDPSKGETSRFALGLLAGLNAADLTRPILLRPWAMAKGETMLDGTPRRQDGAGVTCYQGGVKLTPAFIENGEVVAQLAPLPSSTFADQTTYDKRGWDKVGQDLYRSIENKLHPADAESHADDDGIDPAEAMGAANAEHAHLARERA